MTYLFNPAETVNKR